MVRTVNLGDIMLYSMTLHLLLYNYSQCSYFKMQRRMNFILAVSRLSSRSRFHDIYSTVITELRNSGITAMLCLYLYHSCLHIKSTNRSSSLFHVCSARNSSICKLKFLSQRKEPRLMVTQDDSKLQTIQIFVQITSFSHSYCLAKRDTSTSCLGFLCKYAVHQVLPILAMQTGRVFV